MNLKFFLVIAILCLVNSLSFSQKRTAYRSDAANKKVNQANYLIEDGRGNITFIRFNKNTPLSQISDYKRSFHLQKESDLTLKKEYVDELGIKHIKYEQTYNGIRIVGSEIVLHCKGDFVTKANGKLVDTLNINTTPNFSEKDALNIALQAIEAKVYKWQVKGEELLLQKISKDQNATFYPNAELVITSKKYSSETPYQLAYLFDVHTIEPLSRIRIEIDAHTGEIINQYDQLHHTTINGTGESLYNDKVNLKLDFDGTSYKLRDYTRGDGIFTYDLNNGTNYAAAKLFSENDNYINETENHAGVSAHFGSAATYDYYYNNFGRNSFDDKGSAINSYVHYSTNYFNAFWNGSVMTYGDGNGVTTTPLVTLDIVGHEITHAVTEYSAGLIYAYESGALNESFSDIFGQSVEFETSPEIASWNLGDQVYVNGTSMIRSMSNPKSQGDPDTYKGNYWVNGNAVHTNSGVMNYWYYLLVEGGTGTNDKGFEYEVNGIGLNDAQQIAYRNLTVYLTENSQYMDARVGAEEAAVDLFGENSVQHLAVVDAWNAVGVPTAEPLLIVTNELDFGDIPVGLTQDLELMITNQGNAILNISSISVDNPDFSLSESSLNLEASKSASITVSFTPTVESSHTGKITIKSNGGDEIVNLLAVGVPPPVMVVNPKSFSESLYTGETATQSLTIDNSSGGSDLELSISIISDTSKVGLVKSIKQYGDLGGESFQSVTSELTSISPSFTGDQLSFNISTYGEIMPYQYPIGTEHLLQGSYISGYTIVYEMEGTNYISVAGYNYRTNITPVSYTEIVNNETQLIVEVVTRTSNGVLEITRRFTHDKSSSYIKISTTLSNISGKTLLNVVLKSFADWDVEGESGDDNWSIDPKSGFVYAFNSTYHSLVSNQAPDFQDIDGWDDYRRRLTDENVYGVVNSFDGLQVLHFELGNLGVGGSKDLTTAYLSGNSLDDLLDQLGNVSNTWLSVEESTITIPSGTSREVAVTFDASRLNGGTYSASLALESNDPLNPSVAIPVTLEVTGAPDIEVSLLNIDFGSHFIGAVAKDSLLVSNKGTDTLSISAISVSDADFSIEEGFPTTLSPGEEAYLNLHYSPTIADSLNATLTIESDDTDEGAVIVNLTGKGVASPEITVNQEHLSESLYKGETTTQILNIDNTNGGSDLQVEIKISHQDTFSYSFTPSNLISVESSSTSNSFVSIVPQKVEDDIVNVLVIQNGSAWGVNISQFIGTHFNLQASVIGYGGIESEDFSKYDLIITSGAQSNFYYQAISNYKDKFEEFAQAGGCIVYLLATQGSNVSIVGDVEVLYGNQERVNLIVDEDHPIVKDMDTAINGSYANHGYLTNLPFDSDTLISTQSSKDPTLAVYKYGAGLVLATGVTVEHLYNYNSVPLLGNIMQFALNNLPKNWLSVEEKRITVPSGSNRKVVVSFDATELENGTYLSSLILESNDPINPSITLPVSLEVKERGPEIEVNKVSIDLGTHDIGTFLKDTILISNKGTDTLWISDVSFSDSDFSIEGPPPVYLSPGAETYLIIRCSAQKLGLSNSILTIVSNDKDEKEFLVDLTITIKEAITPEAPTGLLAEPVSQTQVDLLWDTVAHAEAYDVLSSDSELGPFTILATVYAPNTFFSHSGLSPNQTIFYQVRAKFKGKISPVNTTSITTLATEIDAPTGFTVSELGLTKNQLTWNAPSKEIDGYILEMAEAEAGPFTVIAEPKANATSYNHTGLIVGQINFYRLKARSGAQESEYTPVVSFVTSTDELTNSVLRVYPNPTNNGKIILDIGSDVLSNVTITIFTSTGTTVITKTYEMVNGSISIDLGKNNKGMFLMNMISDKFIATRKIIIQ